MFGLSGDRTSQVHSFNLLALAPNLKYNTRVGRTALLILILVAQHLLGPLYPAAALPSGCCSTGFDPVEASDQTVEEFGGGSGCCPMRHSTPVVPSGPLHAPDAPARSSGPQAPIKQCPPIECGRCCSAGVPVARATTQQSNRETSQADRQTDVVLAVAPTERLIAAGHAAAPPPSVRTRLSLLCLWTI